jgi:ABC-2 type transport system permease protein
MKTPMDTKGSSGFRQWRAMLAISRASLKSMLRSPSAVIFGLLFPLVFIVAFGYLRTNSIKLDVAIDPGSDTSGVFYRSVVATPGFRITTGNDSSTLGALLQKGRIDAILRIHPPDAQKERITVVTSKASRERSLFVLSAVENIVHERNLARLETLARSSDPQIRAAMQNLPVTYESVHEEVNAREYKTIDFILPGQLGFSILSAGVFGTAFVFFSLRQTLVLKRFFATPIRRIHIIFGEALSRLMFQMAGSTIIILLGRFVFGFTLVNGWWTALQLLLLSACGLIVFMGFGFVISGLARTESSIPPLANIITLPQFLLSGTFFPVDAFPGWLQMVSKALPLTYLNDALRRVAFEGAGFVELLPDLAVVFGWGIVIYLLAIRFFRWE